MSVTPVYRKTKRTYNEPGHAHFLTCSCYQRLPLLGKDRSRQWVLDAFENLREKFQVDLWAYVIMPEHFHLLIRPRNPEYRVEYLLAAIKRPISGRAKAFLQENGQSEWLQRLTVRKGTEQVFRFWQTGGGFDHNIWNDKPVQEVIRYIHANPVRRGLVAEARQWEWSSAAFWDGDEHVRLKMDLLEV